MDERETEKVHGINENSVFNKVVKALYEILIQYISQYFRNTNNINLYSTMPDKPVKNIFRRHFHSFALFFDDLVLYGYVRATKVSISIKFELKVIQVPEKFMEHSPFRYFLSSSVFCRSFHSE